MDNNENKGVEYEMPEMVKPTVEPTQPSEDRPDPPTGAAIRAMVFGILSIELAVLGVIGIVFAALARKWSLPIIENYPYTKERLFAKAGRITGGVGLGISIGMTVFWCLYILVIAGVIMTVLTHLGLHIFGF